MACSKGFLGCQDDVISILTLRDKLNEQAIDHLNRSQELMLTGLFMQESNEYRYRTNLMERLADVESWKWVLTDLSKRLGESLQTLDYERECLTVVIQRISNEIQTHCKEASMPGALEPFSDAVEKAIMLECKYLCRQKKEFIALQNELLTVQVAVDRAKRRIDRDVANKQIAIEIDQSTLQDKHLDQCVEDVNNKNATPVSAWEQHCRVLKQAGLQALCSASITRQQLRGARVQLSVDSQAYAVKVDAVLRRRLHANQRKVDELEWQRNEIIRDINSLDNEIQSNQDSLAENERHIRRIAARICERRLRPRPEHTMDQAQETLKAELTMLKKNGKALFDSMNEIGHLKQRHCNMLIRIEDVISDVSQVVQLDTERVNARNKLVGGSRGEEEADCAPEAQDEPLPVIVEEREDI